MPATSSQRRRLRPSLSTTVATPPSRSGSVPGSTPNRKQCSSTFSAQMPTFLRGVPRTCLTRRGMSPSARQIFGQEPNPSNGLCADDTRGLRPSPPGKAACHRQRSGARNVQAGRRSRRGLRRHLERPTATSLLPLRCFQVVHIARTHAKFSQQGRVGLASAKPDPPSGAKRGETPSASKFSSKKDLFHQNIFRAFRLLRKVSPGNDGVHVSSQG
jgi:hypothetical protein